MDRQTNALRMDKKLPKLIDTKHKKATKVDIESEKKLDKGLI